MVPPTLTIRCCEDEEEEEQKRRRRNISGKKTELEGAKEEGSSATMGQKWALH